jgi:hypothetical protein
LRIPLFAKMHTLTHIYTTIHAHTHTHTHTLTHSHTLRYAYQLIHENGVVNQEILATSVKVRYRLGFGGGCPVLEPLISILPPSLASPLAGTGGSTTVQEGAVTSCGFLTQMVLEKLSCCCLPSVLSLSLSLSVSVRCMT